LIVTVRRWRIEVYPRDEHGLGDDGFSTIISAQFSAATPPPPGLFIADVKVE